MQPVRGPVAVLAVAVEGDEQRALGAGGAVAGRQVLVVAHVKLVEPIGRASGTGPSPLPTSGATALHSVDVEERVGSRDPDPEEVGLAGGEVERVVEREVPAVAVDDAPRTSP